MADEAMFRREGDVFTPLSPARGYWREDSIGGRPIIGLIGQEIERRHGGDGLMPARLNVDMHRMARFAPMELATTVVRDGGRLRLVEAVLTSGGVEYARAMCQFLQPTTPPPGEVWQPTGPWQVPLPEQMAPDPNPHRLNQAEWRVVSGGLGHIGPRRTWLRDHVTVIAGERLTPFGRVALCADIASPWIHSSDKGIFYINTDLIVQLHRLPEGEWLGLEATGHEASQGVAVGNCRLHDSAGAIGFISATALAHSRS